MKADIASKIFENLKISSSSNFNCSMFQVWYICWSKSLYNTWILICNYCSGKYFIFPTYEHRLSRTIVLLGRGSSIPSLSHFRPMPTQFFSVIVQRHWWSVHHIKYHAYWFWWAAKLMLIDYWICLLILHSSKWQELCTREKEKPQTWHLIEKLLMWTTSFCAFHLLPWRKGIVNVMSLMEFGET